MVTIGFKNLQEHLATVFARWYPTDVAIELAALHAQLHFDFAASLGQVTMADGRVEEARVPEAAVPRRKFHHRGDGKRRVLSESALRAELIELMVGIERPMTQTEIAARLKVFGASEQWVGDALVSMVADGEARRLAANPVKYQYFGHLPEPDEKEVRQAIAGVTKPAED